MRHYYKHGLTNHPLYKRYYHILSRCNNKNNKDHHHYGGRGIKCEWETFIDFYNDMSDGFSDGLEIDRIDNNGNYSKDNCRWATVIQQANNTSTNVFIEYNGEKLTIAQWSRRLGIRDTTFRLRIARGWSIDRAITTIVNYKNETKPIKHVIRIKANAG